MEQMAGRVVVTVVAGGSRSGKSHLIRQMRDGCPPGQRWAWLDNSVGGLQDGRATAGGAIEAAHYFPLAGGCACCVAGAAFRVTLLRLLRAGPWDGLHIEVDPAGHGHVLVDQLRSAPFDQYLEVGQLLLTIHPAEAEQYRSEGDHLQPLSRLDMATDILLRADDRARSGTFEAWLQSAPPWPRLLQAVPPPQAGWRLPAELPGWRIFSLAEPADAPQLSGSPPLDDSPPVRLQAGCLVCRWPADLLGQRGQLRALLTALSGDGDVIGFQALLRTPRAWYRWMAGRGSGVAGAPVFDAGPHLVDNETAWRFDNRICLWLRPDALRSGALPVPVAAGLEALAAALAGAGETGDGSLGQGARY